MRTAIASNRLGMVDALCGVLGSTPEHALAWVAGTGAKTLAKCASDLPDLLLLDLDVPGAGETDALCGIIRKCGCAVLLITGTKGNTKSRVFEAMGCGALDAAAFSGDGDQRDIDDLLVKIATIARLIGKQSGPAYAKSLDTRGEKVPPLVAIGASTGGPKAVAQVLAGLPADFPAAVVVIQHVDPDFTQGLSDWLGKMSSLAVSLARQGDRPEPGKVLVAGAYQHLIITSDRKLAYTDEPEDSPYCPSVDAFFLSAEKNWFPNHSVAVLLTGMGKDGAHGLSRLQRAGWATIAQDEETSVVFGMPKAAIELKAAGKILPLSHIPAAILMALKKKSMKG